MSTTYPAGFRAVGVTAGLKASGAPDLALVVNDGPHVGAAAVFTSNRVVGAPVTYSRSALAAGATARAVVLNSGCSNVCTGDRGLAASLATAEAVAGLLGTEASEVLVASTGVIGVHLDVDTLIAGLPGAANALKGDDAAGQSAAQAIMTTDTVPKTVAHEVFLNGMPAFRIGGMAKGAGMLAPAMATMLCVITTDADVSALAPGELEAALNAAVHTTFNRIDSDGCMSTSDSVFLLASGASGHQVSAEELAGPLTTACQDLARQLVADAEGATHDIQIVVTGATTEDAALAVARSVSRSNLVKTAVAGNDPNWGRILAQVGTVPEDVAPFDPAQLDVSVNGVQVCRAGAAFADPSEVDMAAQREVVIAIDLHAGAATATLWTNDLTHGYITENADYTT